MNKFALSNLAFKEFPIDETLMFLCDSPVEGLEIAPTLIWNKPESTTINERKEFKDLVSDHGLSIIALQSLLFGKPELQLFGDSMTQETLTKHIKEMINLCCDLGGKSLSFGSPKNRIKGDLDFREAISRASPLFFTLAEYAKTLDITLCFEPVSPEYNCDFITDTKEAVALIESVGHSHFKLLLDVGNLILSKDNCENTIRKNIHHIAHIHINDPKLLPPSSKMKEHSIIAETLNSVGYSGWLSLEFLDCHTSFKKDVTDGIQCYQSS
jgi:D-psicose/D-tagatose/L-ribulose 3-epimerase